MAKQTFTTGQVLTAAQMTSLQQTAMLGGDATAKTANYVLTAADAGGTVTMNSSGTTTITVNTSIFSAGDTVTIINLGSGVSTITAGTATVSTSGSLALSQNQGGILRFTSASASIFFQFSVPAAAAVPANASATVATGQTTSSTSYTDLTTSGPAVTVTTGTKALVIVTCNSYNDTNDRVTYMSYAVSGATTVSASDTVAKLFKNPSGSAFQSQRMSSASVVTLTAGSNTFTAKYKVNDGTGTFIDREIFVMNLA